MAMAIVCVGVLLPFASSTRTSVVNVPRTMRSSSPLTLASSSAFSTSFVLAQFITPSCDSVALSRFACACLKEVIFCDVGMRASFDVSLPHCSRNARRMRIGGSPSATHNSNFGLELATEALTLVC